MLNWKTRRVYTPVTVEYRKCYVTKCDAHREFEVTTENIKV